MAVGTIQSLIAVLLSTIALVLTARQHRIARSANRDSHTRTLLLSLSAEYRTDAFQQSECYVLRRLADEFSPDVGLSGLSAEARTHVCRVGHHYGDYGMLVMLPTADRAQILSYVHGRVRAAWRILQPYAEAERVQVCDTEAYWSYFENLAFLAMSTDKLRILDCLGLRRFDGSRWSVGDPPARRRTGRLKPMKEGL
jgi:hypothetical protein